MAMPVPTVYVSAEASTVPGVVSGLSALRDSAEYRGTVAVEAAWDTAAAPAAWGGVDVEDAALLCSRGEFLRLRALKRPSAMTVIVFVEDEAEAGEEEGDDEEEAALEEIMQAGIESLEMVIDSSLWCGGGVAPGSDGGDGEEGGACAEEEDVAAVDDDAAYRVAPSVYISSYKGVGRFLGGDGERSVLSLLTQTEEELFMGAWTPDACPRRRLVRLRDGGEKGSELLDVVGEAVAYVRGEVAAGREVLVHCVAGVSRSAAVVAACLLAQGSAASPEEAIALVREARPWVQPNPSFEECLRVYAGLVCGGADGVARRRRLSFDPCFTDVVLSGEKRATTRRVGSEELPVVGEVCVAAAAAGCGGGGEEYAALCVTRVEAGVTFAGLGDELARVEGMADADELRRVLLRYYPDLAAESQLVAVHFAVVCAL